MHLSAIERWVFTCLSLPSSHACDFISIALETGSGESVMEDSNAKHNLLTFIIDYVS